MIISDSKVELVDKMGSDLSVVNAARVSFHKFTEEMSEKDEGLIRYLASHGHWTPFAHTSLSFRIKAPIFVARQLVKHQVGGVWNEVSRRYVDEEPEFYFPKVWRGKPVNAKQGSSDLQVNMITTDWNGDVEANDILWSLSQRHEDYYEAVLGLYNAMIAANIAPEQARMVLPQNTMTEWIWTGSLMFFARVCKQRLDPHAQQETREVAQLINDHIPEDFNISWKTLLA